MFTFTGIMGTSLRVIPVVDFIRGDKCTLFQNLNGKIPEKAHLC